jgi:hypothetical protein
MQKELTVRIPHLNPHTGDSRTLQMSTAMHGTTTQFKPPTALNPFPIQNSLRPSPGVVDSTTTAQGVGYARCH